LYGISCTCRNFFFWDKKHFLRHTICGSGGKKKRNRLSWGLPLNYQSAQSLSLNLCHRKQGHAIFRSIITP
jgi:hypothetical protein